MPRANVPLLTFNRGRISKLGLGRVDIGRISLSADRQTNFPPRTLGSMMLRPGTEYIGTINNSSTAILVPFVFSNNDTALLEFTSTNGRIWVPTTAVNAGMEVLQRDGSTAVVTNGTFDSDLTGWTDSDESGATSEFFAGGFMSLVGTRHARAIRRQTITSSSGTHGLKTVIERGNVLLRVGSSAGADDYFGETTLRPGSYSFGITSTGNFFLEFSANTEYRSLVDSVAIESSGDVSLDSTWPSSDLSLLRWDQSGDVIFTAAKGFQQKRIERHDPISWGIAQYEPEDGPFRSINITNKRLTPSALSGDITLSCDQPLFSSDHVGALFELTSIGQTVETAVTGTDQWSDPIRVSGVGETRIFDVLITGTWVATARVQRSVGEVGSWSNVSGLSWTSTIDTAHADGLDNQIVFYRIGVGSTFTSGTVDARLNYASGGLTGVAKINSVTGATESSARVLINLGSTQATETWKEGDWSDFRGYPSAVAFHEGRLFWAGKSKIWGSIPDAFESFDPNIEGDSGVINRQIATGPVDEIQWIQSLGRLVVGTDDRELEGKTNSLEEPLTPTNFTLREISKKGSAPVSPVKTDRGVLYVQKSGIRVMEIQPGNDGISLQSADKTALVPEIGEPEILRLGVQRQPDTRIHAVRGSTDGTVGLLVSEPLENVTGWIDIESSGGVNGLIEEVAVLPSAGEDEVYYIVKREINGSTVRYLERLASEWDARGGRQFARGSFRVNANSSTAVVSSVEADSTELLGSPIAWQDNNNNTAVLVASQIGSPGDVPVVESFAQNEQDFTPGATSLTVAKPTGTVEGELLLAQFGADSDLTDPNPSMLPPAGWTEIYQAQVEQGGSSTGIAHFGGVWRKKATATETSDYTWELSGTTSKEAMVGAITRISGQHPTDPIADSDFTTFKSSAIAGVIAPGATTSNANNLIITTVNAAWELALDINAASTDQTLEYNVDVASGGAGAAIEAYSETQATAGSVPTRDMSGGALSDGHGYIAGTIAIRPAGGGNITASAIGNTVNLQSDSTSEVTVIAAGDAVVDQFFSLSGGRSFWSPARKGTAENRMADSFIVQNTSDKTTTVSGLDHLVGSSVIAWGNNKDLGSYTVSSTGTIELTEASSNTVVRLPYSGLYESAKLAQVSEAGTGLTQRKNVNHVGIVAADMHAQGLQYGPSTDRLDDLPRIEGGEFLSTNIVHDVYDRESIEFPGEWNTDSRLVLKAQAPRPVTILGAVVQIDTKEKV